MDDTKEVTNLKERIRRLEIVIVDMTQAMKILTEGEERAQEFVNRIDEIAQTITIE